MDTCGMNFIKYLLFAFNLVFAISGLGIIIAGGVVLSDVSDFKHFTQNELIGPPVVLIIAGSIVFLIAFLGCYGAIRESYNMLIAFAALLLIIFILELAAGIAAAVYNNDFQDVVKKTLSASMSNYSGNEVERLAWDKLQNKMKCCGVEKKEDWKLPNNAGPFPKSCCHDGDATDPDVTAADFCKQQSIGSTAYSRGCFEKVKLKIESNMKVLIGVGIGIAFVEIVGIVLACWLAYTIKKEGDSK